MKFRIGHFDYNEDREGNPYLFTVIGTPDLKAEWEQFKGETRQTMTLAEVEAKGIALPAALGAGTAEAAKRFDAVKTERDDAIRATAEIAAKLENARKALE